MVLRIRELSRGCSAWWELPTAAGARASMVGRALLARGHARYVSSAHPAGARLGGGRGAAVRASGCSGTCGNTWLMHALEDGRPQHSAEPNQRVSGGTQGWEVSICMNSVSALFLGGEEEDDKRLPPSKAR